jgi:hypothetical protein
MHHESLPHEQSTQPGEEEKVLEVIRRIQESENPIPVRRRIR